MGHRSLLGIALNPICVCVCARVFVCVCVSFELFKTERLTRICPSQVHATSGFCQVSEEVSPRTPADVDARMRLKVESVIRRVLCLSWTSK